MEADKTFSGLPFYVFISLIVGSMAAIGLYSLWAAGKMLQFGLFAALAGLHLAAYWLYVRWYDRPWAQKGFYALQTVLLLGIFLVLRKESIAVTILACLLITLIGQSIGFWGNTWRALYLGLFYTALGVILMALLVPWQELGWLLLTLAVNGGFVVILLVVLNRQLAEQRKVVELAETLETTNAKLTAYAAQIEHLALQNERQRIARELHDTLAQGVAGLSLQLEAIKMHLQSGRSERALAIAGQALNRAHATLADSRAAIDGLRVGPQDLEHTLRQRAARFSETSGIPCTLEIELDSTPLPPDFSGHVLRILDESLTNIARHAQATQASISLHLQHSRLDLYVRDDGQGLSDNPDAGVGHYGLIGMDERARLLGGSLEVASQPGAGVTIHFSAPALEKENAL